MLGLLETMELSMKNGTKLLMANLLVGAQLKENCLNHKKMKKILLLLLTNA